MKANLKDIIESIPDYDDFMALASEIGELSFKKMQFENHIKAEESRIFKEAMTNDSYRVDGKRPSVSFVENAYMHTGFDGSLTVKRETLADISAQLDKKRIQLSIYRDMLEVFRTVSANERNSSI